MNCPKCGNEMVDTVDDDDYYDYDIEEYTCFECKVKVTVNEN